MQRLYKTNRTWVFYNSGILQFIHSGILQFRLFYNSGILQYSGLELHSLLRDDKEYPFQLLSITAATRIAE